MHGIQSLAPGRNREPLSYYARSGPVGQVFEAFSGSENLRRVAVVGLGAGTMACYAAPDEGIQRSNETHESKRDPEAELARKRAGKEAKLRYSGNLLVEAHSQALQTTCKQ
jgi:hypothetical protein